MKTPPSNKNKFWIYLPLYLIVLTGSVWGFYEYLRVKPKVEPEPMEFIVDSKKESTFMDCFSNKRDLLEGVIKITPYEILDEFASELDEKCREELCKVSSRERFYQKAKSDKCFRPFLNAAIDYHHKQIENSIQTPIFFNSGVTTLTNNQTQAVRGILDLYISKPDKYGALIIGRASKDDNPESNKVYSKNRANSITKLIQNFSGGKFKSDFVYFGSESPQLDEDIAKLYGIRREKYKNVAFSGSTDKNYSKRLNQSVLLVIYSLDEDPFGLNDK